VPDVVLSPDPIIAGQNNTFTITAEFSEDIQHNDSIYIVFIKYPTQIPIEPTFYDNICKYLNVSCPVTAGTNITATISVPVPASLPSTYAIGIVVINSSKQYLSCAIAIVDSSKFVNNLSLSLFYL
ncbi:38991_t:CDS:2, partial [Gigaspora margarita]